MAEGGDEKALEEVFSSFKRGADFSVADILDSTFARCVFNKEIPYGFFSSDRGLCFDTKRIWHPFNEHGHGRFRPSLLFDLN